MIWKEDKLLIRTGNAPQVWSALANLVITLFRIHGVTRYTEETCRCAQDPAEPSSYSTSQDSHQAEHHPRL